MAAGVDYCGPLKTNYKGFCIATLENLMKNCPEGSYIVMNSTPIVPGGRPLLDIGYKYNPRKVPGFITNEGFGITEPGDPRLSRFPDIYSIFSVRPVICTQFLGRHYNACNSIDNHKMMCKSDMLL